MTPDRLRALSAEIGTWLAPGYLGPDVDYSVDMSLVSAWKDELDAALAAAAPTVQAVAGKELPIAWFDHFNAHVYFDKAEADRATAGGNMVSPVISMGTQPCAPTVQGDAVAWMLRRKTDGFIRGCSSSAPSDESLEIAAIDGDEYVALYTQPPAAVSGVPEEVGESLCELEVMARNYANAASIGRIGDEDLEGLRRAFGRLADMLYVIQERLTEPSEDGAELKDWREMFTALCEQGLDQLDPTFKPEPLWPNNWHQDVAYVAKCLHDATPTASPPPGRAAQKFSSGEYVLLSDMQEIEGTEFGAGLFATWDCVRESPHVAHICTADIVEIIQAHTDCEDGDAAYTAAVLEMALTDVAPPNGGAVDEFRAEVERIAHDYIPDNDSYAPLALSEMRDALLTALTTKDTQ